MTQLRLLSAAEQVAEHLITEIQSGQYNNEMPGAMRLSKTYGVNHKTMESALQLLEKKMIGRRIALIVDLINIVFLQIKLFHPSLKKTD